MAVYNEPFTSARFGEVASIEFDVSTDMIDVTTFGSAKTMRPGLRSLSITLVLIDASSEFWHQLFADEGFEFDETIQSGGAAIVVRGRMRATSLDVCGPNRSELRLSSCGPFTIEKADPVAAALRKRVREIQKEQR